MMSGAALFFTRGNVTAEDPRYRTGNLGGEPEYTFGGYGVILTLL
jgi:hypothetical protein